MSGDVQPRKRKEKRRKKEDSEEIPTSFTSDEQLHVHKDASTGGNICAKILFFLLSFVLLVMIGLVVFEYRGSTDDETLVPVSKWAPTFDGWLETPVKHDEHADVTESGEQEHGESGEHETESAEGEDHLSEEAVSKEEEDDEKGSEEEDTKSGEEEEEEDEDEEADKLKDEESEEVDENEIEDRDEDEEQDEEEEEGSEEDVDDHGKSEEDAEAEKEGQDDDDDDGEEEDEEEDAEDGREELDEEEEEEEEEERDMPAYQRESDEIDDLLSEIPGITESDEDEEGDNLGRSDEIITKQQKIPGVHEKKIKSVSEEEVEVPRRKQEKEVGGDMKSGKTSQDKTVEEEEEGEDEPEPSGVPKARKLQREDDEESGSDKEIPVTKSKIPKNMGGQNAQIYSKADITNEDDWHIIQELDRADDDAEEDLNF